MTKKEFYKRWQSFINSGMLVVGRDHYDTTNKVVIHSAFTGGGVRERIGNWFELDSYCEGFLQGYSYAREKAKELGIHEDVGSIC